MKYKIPESAIVGNIYDVYRNRDHKVLLRTVQVIKYDHPNIHLTLISKTTEGQNSQFYSKVSVHALRQPEWKLKQANAELKQDEVKNPPEVIKNVISTRAPKLMQGKTIEDVRVGDIWEVRGTNENLKDAYALIQILDVTDRLITITPLEREPKIRLYPVISRDAFKDGRYKLIERNKNAPVVPRSPRIRTDRRKNCNPLNGVAVVESSVVEPVDANQIDVTPVVVKYEKCIVPIEMLSMIETDRKNGTLADRYSHMTWKGNVIVARKCFNEESKVTSFEFEWNPGD